MPSDSEVMDPLLRAIAELRVDLNHLINEQIACVKERWEEPPVLRSLRTAPPLTPAPALTPVPAAVPVPAPAPASAPAPALVVAGAPEAAAKPRTLDPRQRLDALAKRLDHRARQANVPGAERAERSPTPEG
jgi:hypothetical protein